MVREEDAYALAADVAMLLAAKGHKPVITPENMPWLMRGCAQVLAALGIGARDPEEDGYG